MNKQDPRFHSRCLVGQVIMGEGGCRTLEWRWTERRKEKNKCKFIVPEYGLS